jgi:hypothetical protein
MLLFHSLQGSLHVLWDTLICPKDWPGPELGVRAMMRLSKDSTIFGRGWISPYPKLNDANLLLPFDDLPRLGKPK